MSTETATKPTELVEQGEPKYRILLYQVALGTPLEEISENLDLSIKTIRGVLASPLMKKELKKVEKKIRERVAEFEGKDMTDEVLTNGTYDAARKLVELIDSATEQVSLTACNSILRMKGYDKQEVHVKKEVTVTSDELTLLNQVMAVISGMGGKLISSVYAKEEGIVDVEPVGETTSLPAGSSEVQPVLPG